LLQKAESGSPEDFRDYSLLGEEPPFLPGPVSHSKRSLVSSTFGIEVVLDVKPRFYSVI
jgi:hypothetical protein